VIWHVGIHRTDNAQIISARGDMREYFTNFNPALTVFCEFERRSKGNTRFPFSALIVRGQRFTMMFVEQWFWIEGVHMRRTTIHE
jgi:hypothetical protein